MNTSVRKPVLAIVSHTLRRDLEEPLRHFTKVQIVHLYHDASYKDMKEADFASKPIRYQDANDLTKRLLELKPDIIQGPEPYASKIALRNAWAVYRYATKYQTPYFFPMFENQPARIKFGPLVGTIMEWILGRYAGKAVGVISLNAGATNSLRAAGVAQEKITRLTWGTWGIDVDEFKPNNRVRAKRPTVFFVGRISAKKGLDDLLSCWPKVLAAVPGARLIVGGPTLDSDGEQLLTLVKQTPACEYVGPIKHTELPRYFQEAWVTVAPSVTTPAWAEQVGMINLQSLACGTPVVTTRSGAIPQYVSEGNGAILVDEHDPEALAESILFVLESPKDRDRLGKKGRTYIEKTYEVAQNVRRCEQYVLDLLAKSNQ